MSDKNFRLHLYVQLAIAIIVGFGVIISGHDIFYYLLAILFLYGIPVAIMRIMWERKHKRAKLN